MHALDPWPGANRSSHPSLDYSDISTFPVVGAVAAAMDSSMGAGVGAAPPSPAARAVEGLAGMDAAISNRGLQTASDSKGIEALISLR